MTKGGTLQGAPCVAFERARVGTGTLRQHEVRLLKDERTLVLSMALSPPRLWAYLARSALDSFEAGFERPHDGRASTRLHQGLLAAQHGVRSRVDILVERRPPDVALFAISLDQAVLHIVGVGPLRAYCFRRKLVRRLCVREDSPEGLLKSTASWCAEPIEPGDLVWMGSITACSEPALERARSLLDERPATPLDQLIAVLHEPARVRGAAAVSVMLRFS